MGRANCLFADTITGANVNAIMYSIVETAKANRADVRLYLQYLLEKTAEAIDAGNADDRAFLESMMPWSSEYREYEEKEKRLALEYFKNLFNETVRPRTPKKRKQKATNELDALNDTA